jgi:hypothetical protein
MRLRLASLVCLASLALLVPVRAFAQDATLIGNVVDGTKAALPGTTITATLIDTGRASTTVTDDRGEYRLRGLAPGRYRVQAELSGFSTVVIPDIELLVGQNRSLPFQMQVASLSETLTVTGEAPLVDVSSTQVAGNVDRRQMEELPLQGRNWMELAMQVKGITANAVDTTPGVRDRAFQLNLDGQEITQQVAGSGFGQPKFSREAIAEFQVVTNLFDITQGRSLGIQVQAISRSGTNNYDGSVYGYFRDDKWNAKDFIANRVLPYANQQLGGAIGGPLIKDKAHFFLSFERENEPNTILTSVAALPGSSWSFDTKLLQNSFLGRGDWQWTQNDHLTFRASYWDWGNDFTQVSGTEHPSQAAARYRKAINMVGTWAKVLSPTKLQEVKIGYTHFDWQNLLAVPSLANTPNYVFANTVIFGQRRNYPQEFFQNTISARYDLTMTAGRHDMKVGGEFLRWHDTGQWQLLSRGEYIFPSIPADLARRFPVDAWDDPSRWDVSGLDPLVQRFDQNFGDWTIDIPRPTWAVWFGDTWRMADQFTVNYGVRWDADWGALDPPHITTQATFDPAPGWTYPDLGLEPGAKLYPNNLRDLGSVAPRGGFTWNVGGRGDLVIRGGSGLYYSIPDSNTTFSIQSFNGERILVNSFANDNQPGFIQNPTRGRTPEDFLSGRFPVPPQGPRVIAHDYQMPSTWQSIFGMQKQIGSQLGFEADFTHWKGYNFARQRDPNLFLDPTTGYNRNPNQGRPDPKYGQIQWLESNGRADYAAISTGLNRRYANNWQASTTYTYMLFMRDNTNGFQSQGNNPFDPEAEWARSTDFQRHTLRFNGIWRLPYDISVSGAYLFGSGNYYPTTIALNPFGHTGTTRLNRTPTGTAPTLVIPESIATSGANPDVVPVRDRFEGPASIAAGEIAPRNALRGLPLHRIDFRVSKDLNLPSGMRLTGIAEVFNVTNHANYGAYNGQINSTTFGQPRQNLLNAYQPRVMQLAFKVGF